MPQRGISNESIKYYASLINYDSVFQMNQFEENLTHIYLLCFVYYRYQRLHDNLINCFIYRVRQLLDEAKSVARDRVYEYRLEHNRNLQKAGQVLKSGDVFCRNSVRFRSFEDDLLSDDQWREKEALILKAGLPILTQTAEAHLAELKDLLETRLKQVNERIASGGNEQFEVKKGGR